MSTRPITLTDHQETIIRCLLANGRYRNADEILHDGLRLVERQERHETTNREHLCPAPEAGCPATKGSGQVYRSWPECWIAQPQWPQEAGTN
jgi:putative addiction module CopG family antidote